MGMQGKGEIELLSDITKPDIAVITNIGEAHIERLKSILNIVKAKCEILKHLGDKGIAVLNADDKFFDAMKIYAGTHKIISFGFSKKADLRATNLKEHNDSIEFELVYKKTKVRITVPLPGVHNVLNALCALSTAAACGLSINKAKSGLMRFIPSSKRMNITSTKALRIINDTYNANPTSMKAALSVLASQNNSAAKGRVRRIAVLGDMLELGALSDKCHKEIGKLPLFKDIEILITVGKEAKLIANEAKKHFKTVKSFSYDDNNMAAEKLITTLSPNDIVLLKASRGMKFEEIANKILDTRI